MKLYLSSYRLGDHSEELKKLIGQPGAKVAVSVNALDHLEPEIRNEKLLNRELDDMKNLGFEAEEIDLRNYFKKEGLLEKMRSFDAVWFSGGNTFLLTKAFNQSGFDGVFKELVMSGNLVYSGYSAAFCVLTPSLHGVELVDDKNVEAKGYPSGEVWEGLGVIDFYPIVHFRSGHHESGAVDEMYGYVRANNFEHKTFKDGDVYLVDGERKETLVK